MRRAGDLLEGTSGDNKGGRCGGPGLYCAPGP